MSVLRSGERLNFHGSQSHCQSSKSYILGLSLQVFDPGRRGAVRVPANLQAASFPTDQTEAQGQAKRRYGSRRRIRCCGLRSWSAADAGGAPYRTPPRLRGESDLACASGLLLCVSETTPWGREVAAHQAASVQLSKISSRRSSAVPYPRSITSGLPSSTSTIFPLSEDTMKSNVRRFGSTLSAESRLLR